MLRFSVQRALLFALLCSLSALLASSSQSRAQGLLGLTATNKGGLWEGKTDYNFALRPSGKVRAIMIFARFTDCKIQEDPKDLYNRLAPEGIAFFNRASYGKVTLQIAPLLHWIAMDGPTTSPGYNTRTFEGHKTYIEEAIRKVAKEVDFTPYDIVYVVGSQGPGTPISPTWGAAEGEGILIRRKEIRHAVTFGNDCRTDRWGWQTLCHETGHIFGLPDLYSFQPSKVYKDGVRYVGFWDLMSFQAIGSEYFAWQKRKLEWLTDDDFVIARTGSTDALIPPLYEKEGKKAVVAPISQTEAYVAEVRNQEGKPDGDMGVLLYRVSLTAGREGHIKVVPAAPDDNDPVKERRFITLYNALFHDGVVLDDKEAHIRIEIIGRAGKAFRLRVTHP